MNREVNFDYLKAGNPATSTIELERLAAQKQCTGVRLRLAENVNSTLSILLLLAVDEDTDVRIAVAENASSPDWLKAALAKDESPTVRFAVAEDCNTPLEILQNLLEDDNPYVAHTAQATIDSLELETALRESGFAAEKGDCYKLGTILYYAGLLDAQTLEELLSSSKQLGIPLGQSIARRRILPKKVITKALLLQSSLRRSEITKEDMIASLVQEHSSPLSFSMRLLDSRMAAIA